MTCTSCGTRIGKTDRKCPNCGKSQKTRPRSSKSPESGTPALEPSSAQIPGRRQGLRDVRSGGASAPVSSDKPISTNAAKVTPSPGDETPAGLPGRAEIRNWIHECPDRLEEGLSIYTDANTSKANPVGLDFSTDVGEIDLLARDDAGGLVVVLVPAPQSDGSPQSGKDLVGEALERVGWVRKHVAEPTQEVRAIVLLNQVPDDFSYSAAAVASTVSFKTYRLEVSFADVEV